MRMIHEKFKDDVSHHLEDFKSTIEELEGNHSELKGSIKKQSMFTFVILAFTITKPNTRTAMKHDGI